MAKMMIAALRAKSEPFLRVVSLLGSGKDFGEKERGTDEQASKDCCR